VSCCSETKTKILKCCPSLIDPKRVAEYVWEIPKTFRDDMRVPARLYADEDLLDAALLDNSVVQLVNTATLPGVIRYAIAMPSPGLRLPDRGSRSDTLAGRRDFPRRGASVKEVKPYLEDITSRLYANCPSGVGSHGQLRLSNTELDQGLHEGSRWMMDEGYASRADLDRTEEFGRIPGADAAFVSDRARERGRNQLGTLGAGNHFIEVDRVAEVYDQTTAARLGHQICQDYVSRSLHPAVGLGLSSGSVSISSSF
jgi:tRNA-splicing ligase RtcB (3'-phosphate/5'-hydroxy nucleic acid ligase)